VATKFKVDLEALKKQLSKEIAVTQILENLSLPKEAKPYIFNAIKRLQKKGVNIVKVKPGVYKTEKNGKKAETKPEEKAEEKKPEVKTEEQTNA
jgi:hypothetical protein